ncbi:caveolin-1-like [Brachionus plicatilis]|uniref:Caveolin n=1 Tax=Brachionus plicatilis TaxID=10195 RepID=A0A3M7Q0Q1_BRAPC|nr:caveolin-1-like [Brachionus plicatilis]
MAEIDLINRDPQNLNNFLQVEFDDVLAEPEGTHTIDCVWRNSHKCFKCGKNLCYKILTILTGIFVALYWGCVFASVSYSIIWFVTPLMRLLHIVLHPIKKILSIVLSTFLGPLMQTQGLIFSRIHVTQSQGEPPKPIGEL